MKQNAVLMNKCTLALCLQLAQLIPPHATNM
uniref:Uncharacterized protein n=1 Tax=Solanum lycopersicum TaxID=4081 RepID=A0A3Q7J1K2_SOLLC